MKFPARIVRFNLLLVLAAFGLSTLMTGCDSLHVTHYYEKGALATAAPIATAVGEEVFERGGNAFDVAVAVGFVLAVVHPEAGNIGGGGFALVRDGATGDIRTLDFRETAPSAATDSMYLDADGEVIDSLSVLGARAAGVPGTVAGLHELWSKYGSLPWADLVTPAADLADTGFVIDQYLAESLQKYRDTLSRFEESAALFYSGADQPRQGERLILKDLGSTLGAVAAEGPAGFYKGAVAGKITECMQKHGGLITEADLQAYTPIWREPIRFAFDSLVVFSMPPPSSGGILLGQILKLLEPFDFSKFSSDSPEFIHLFAEASRLAYADRSAHLGDPDFYEIPPGLLGDRYLDRRREFIQPEHAGVSDQVGPGSPLLEESDQTTHFSVCDGEGNVVALTYTLNSSYGSKLAVDGAGFLLNNEMDDFAIKPGHPNLYGLVGGEANEIEPGKRMLSSMSPTIVLKNNRPYLVLGSPGGSKIITTVAQAIFNLTRFHLTPAETVAHPRFHHQWLPDLLYLEEGGFGLDTQQKLIGYGHFLKERTIYGDLQLIRIDPSGLMAPASDPRKRGTSSGF